MIVHAGLKAGRGLPHKLRMHTSRRDARGVPPSGQTVEVCWGMMCPGRDGDACCLFGGVPTSGGVARRR